MDIKGLVSELGKVDWSFNGESTAIDTHTLHPYPAKFPPQIPSTILRIAQQYRPVNRVLDPFGGSGTTALEASKLRLMSTTNDLNRITQQIVAAKLTKPDTEERELLDDHLTDMVTLSMSEGVFSTEWEANSKSFNVYIPDIPNMEKWFDVQTQMELAVIKKHIDDLGAARLQDYCLAVLSSIITLVSFQEEETTYRSVPRSIAYGEALSTYSSRLKSALKSSEHLSEDFTSLVTMTSNDMRFEVEFKDSFDLVITSPPYPNVTDYHLYHRHRNFWLDEDPVIFGKSEIGSHLRHQKENNGFDQYMIEMTNALETILISMVEGGLLFMVVGSGIFNGVEYNTSKYIKESAEKLGYGHIITINRQLPTHNRSFTRPGRRLTEEQIVVLGKGEL